MKSDLTAGRPTTEYDYHIVMTFDRCARKPIRDTVTVDTATLFTIVFVISL